MHFFCQIIHIFSRAPISRLCDIPDVLLSYDWLISHEARDPAGRKTAPSLTRSGLWVERALVEEKV